MKFNQEEIAILNECLNLFIQKNKVNDKKIKQKLESIDGIGKQFKIGCQSSINEPYIVFLRKDLNIQTSEGMYPRIAIIKNDTIQVNINNSYYYKVIEYRARGQIAQYNHDNNSDFTFDEKIKIINKLERDINYFINIPNSELEILSVQKV